MFVNCKDRFLNVFVLDSAAYCVVASESAGRQIPIAYLERVKDDFNKRYAGGKAGTAVANGLNREFGYSSYDVLFMAMNIVRLFFFFMNMLCLTLIWMF